MNRSQLSNVQGTYRLVHRELPDGKVQRPPEVLGIFAYTKTHRYSTVVWKDASGKVYSETYLAEYKLTESEYSETMVYLTVDDQISGKATQHEFSGPSASSPVEVKGNIVKIIPPQSFEKAFSLTFEFEKDTLKATAPGLFVDYWEKVD